MNSMKKSTYLVLVLALFVIEENIYDAWGGVNEGGEEEVTTLKPNYHIPTVSRKLLAFPGYNNSTGSDLVPDSDVIPGMDPGFSFGSGSNMGSGSNTDLVPDANPGSANPGSDPRFNFGSGSGTDLVPDANPISGSGTGTGSTFRIGPGGPDCSKWDIEVDQAQTPPLPNGIPTYTVIISNNCHVGTGPDAKSCTFTDVHLSCGWFSSYILVDPDVFRRLGYNDCLLKNGGNLNPREVISFVYADSFEYPISVTSATCQDSI